MLISQVAEDDDDDASMIDAEALHVWRPDCERLEQAGVYAKLAQLFHLKKGDIFLDICSGACPLEKELLSQHPGAHMLGLEMNTLTNDFAAGRLKQIGVQLHRPVARAGDTLICKSPNGTHSFYERSWESARDHVLVAETNIEESVPIDELLNGQKASATAFTFSGVSLKNFKKKKVAKNERELTKAKLEVYRAALATATAFTAPSGTFLRGERLGLTYKVTPDADFTCAAMLVMNYNAQLSRYWDVTDFKYIQENLKFVCSETPYHVWVLLMTRNSRPCTLEQAREYTRSIDPELLQQSS